MSLIDDLKAAHEALRLLREAVSGLRYEAAAMSPDEIRDQPLVRRNLRLADRIEKFLQKEESRG